MKLRAEAPLNSGSAIPAGRCLPFAAAVYRLAFGTGGGPYQMGHDWGVPPNRWALRALEARAAGKVWRPSEPLPAPAYVYRKAVRQLMRAHEALGAGQGDPVKLLAYARAVEADHASWLGKLRDAEDRLTEAVRDGRLPAFGIRVNSPSDPSEFATYETIRPVLMDAGRSG